MAIDPKLVTIAIDHCAPDAFEKYTQTVFGQIIGPQFKPLGGMHDQGADGFIEDSQLFEDINKPERFFQASKEINVGAKIRRTIARLIQVGRNVRRLYFASSQVVTNSDKLQHDLGEELGVVIDIYDRAFFEQHANDSPAIQIAFDQHLRSSTAFLNDLKGPSFPANAPIENAQAVCAFLGQELERRMGTVKTLQAVCDSLILWSLEDTDPDKGLVLDKDGIISKVISVIPSARRFFLGEVTQRLSALEKKLDGQRTIQYHKKKGGYCLPYETRASIREATLADEKLKADVTASFILRLQEHADKLDEKSLKAIPGILHSVLEGVFEHQGADAARHFLDDDTRGEALNNAAIAEMALEKLRRSGIDSSAHPVASEILRGILRQLFYDSRPVERTYCSRLSRTYVLLFTLRNTPEVIEYFNGMAGNFHLTVGSDIILRALSEHYLRPDDQMAANALKIIRQAGSTLILTESTLAELHSHIFAADREYQSSYADIDAHVDHDLASQSDRILIRAYFYSKLEVSNAKRPRNWRQFIENFLTYGAMNAPVSPVSMKSLRETICNRFGFAFMDHDSLAAGIPKDEIDRLTEMIYQLRHGSKPQDRVRAKNDAMQILRVYQARRSEDKVGGNPFGYRNWWLTQETKSSAAAAATFPERRHMRYTMRPDFLVSYIAYNPTTAEVRASLRSIFPSIHGIRLANRIDDTTLSKVMGHLRDANSVDSARTRAMVAEFSDSLKADRVRQFVMKYDTLNR